MSDQFIDQSPFFTPEQRALAQNVGRFILGEVERREAAATNVDGQFRELLAMLSEAGLLRYAVAKPGGQLDVRSLCLLRESLAYASPLADIAFVMQGLGTYALSIAAPEHVRDFWLSRATSGNSVAALALTEAEAGSDVANIQTTARLEGDAYIINGRKKFISNAGLADFYTVLARTGTRPDGRGELSAFVVSAKMPGFRVVERTRLIGDHPIGEIEFADCRVPAEDILGELGDGYGLAMDTMDTFRASVGAAACGMAGRALDEAIEYAKNRRQFGKPLSEFQLVQSKLAEMATELDAARLLVYHAAYCKDTGADRIPREASEAKYFATEAAQRIIDGALQIHGGNGLVHGHIVERLYRDVRALRIYEGTSEIQKLIIARELLGA
jgi:acyl-CoA dehydrogenase